jgi:hypothetical protein
MNHLGRFIYLVYVKLFMQIIKFLHIIYMFVEVVYEKIIYKKTIFSIEML